ncbi:MAG: Hsp20/alpha crystallin family protein [Myxococcota bacterium]
MNELAQTNPHARTRSLRVDFFEGEDAYVLLADLPGLKEEDLQIELEGARLHLSATRTRGEEAVHFERKVRVPTGIDAENVSARYTNGVLEVRLEKQAALKPRRIAVN